MRLRPVTLCIGLLIPAVAALAQPPLDLGGIVERHEMIPMRDGQRLSAYLYFPAAEGKWPVLFEQRYADLRGAGTRQAAAKLAGAGYVVALVNFRGTHESEGTWVGYRALGWGELKDGYDTCEWLAKQTWSTGDLGSFGSSQGGYAQNFLAVTQPPHLKCQYMVDTGLSLFQEGYRIGGTTRPQRFLAMAANCRNPDDNRQLLEEWFRHPTYDDYWRQEDCSLHFAQMNVPCFTIGSWYDFMNQGSIASFQGREHAGGPQSRGRQQLVIGPWLHGRLNKGNRVGDLAYPENAVWPEHEHMVRWFDYWLKGKDTGVLGEPAVRYYVMGAVGEAGAPGNVWRSADDWPPPNAKETSFFLQKEGGLARQSPTAENSSTSYVSDPLHPMQIPGTAFPGAKDARAFEQQAEVRTFTTEPLTEPIEWTGRVVAELYASSTARDTDFLVRVSDVYPDGRSILLMDYPRRARYRDGFDREALLEPGQVHKLRFEVGWLSQIFNKGHRIRVTVASTGAPLYEPNSQTGGPQTIELPVDAVKATNTVHHSAAHASRIIAPQVDATGSAAASFAAPVHWRVESDPRIGASAAVIAPDAPLIHTAQLMHGEGAPRGTTGIDGLLYDLNRMLGSAGGLKAVIKLNIYAADEEVAAKALQDLPRLFPGESLPAVSLVVTRLPGHGKSIALDAVAVSAHPAREVEFRTGLAATLPPGSRLYISGQAEPGTTLREATRKTLQSIEETLEHCGRSTRDIVQLKCFWQSTGSVAEAQEEIARYFIGQDVPPVSYVEWKMTAPIEIEAVAWGGPTNVAAAEPVEFVTPPALKASPVFSRVARIHRGGTIFFGDVFGMPGASTTGQAQQPFERLKKLLAKTGSDLTHLAKATYYVTDDDVSQALNQIRHKYYDPARPPAASKAVVAGTGRPGARFVMDMIAAPSSRGTPASGPEYGRDLTAEEAAAGWISLFDGETTFGWKDATVEGGLLIGGTTTARFGNCELRAIIAAGTLIIGGQEHAATAGKPLSITYTGERSAIRLGKDTVLKSLAVRPLGLKPLFNGRDLAGWQAIERSGPTDKPSPFWRVEQGVLRAVGGPGAIEFTGGDFGDVVLQISVRSRAVHSNGGVFLRSVAGQFMNGYEVQIHNRCLDDDPLKPFRYTTGGIDDRQDARRLVSRDFATFRMTIVADGTHLATWVNGVQVADWTDDRPPHDNPRQGQRLKPGTLQLQAHDPDTDYEVQQLLAAPLP